MKYILVSNFLNSTYIRLKIIFNFFSILNFLLILINIINIYDLINIKYEN